MGIHEWLAAKGFSASAVSDGKIHRETRLGHHSKSAWYVAWSEPFPMCVAGDWRTGERWEYRDPNPRTRAEEKRAQTLIAQAKANAEKLRAGRQELAALRADIELRSASPADDHPYLARKVVLPYGAVQHDGALLIPMRDIHGQLWGLQRILPDGRKFFLPEQRAAGCFFAIGGQVGPTLYITEGFATGATVHQVTGLPVFCAFSASNLIRVAAAARKLYPDTRIIIAADNDRHTPGNPGVKEAERTARALAPMWVAVPSFRGPNGTDFNDLACDEGWDVARRQLTEPTEFPRAQSVTTDWARRYYYLLSEV